MSKSDLTDISVQVHVKTAKAVLVSDDGDKDKAVWLPLSQIEMEYAANPRFAVVTLPEWLAADKGLI